MLDLDCLSYWFYLNCFSLLIVLVILSNVQWQLWFGILINNIEELVDYQLEVKRSKVKVTRSLPRFMQDQPLVRVINLAYLSALLRRGEKTSSLRHWYLFNTFLVSLFRAESTGNSYTVATWELPYVRKLVLSHDALFRS